MGSLHLPTSTARFNGLICHHPPRFVTWRLLIWTMSLRIKQQDYLTKILFTKAHCLCHDVNDHTKSMAHIDVVMGFSTGEIIWWEPISQRYTRLNKNVRLRIEQTLYP